MKVREGKTIISDTSIFPIPKLICFMESTCKGSCNSVESMARTRFTRGKSLKACVTKTAGWTLEKAKDVTLPEIEEYKMT